MEGELRLNGSGLSYTFLPWLFLLVILLATSPSLVSGSYYLSEYGDDNAMGTSPETAWRTLEYLVSDTQDLVIMQGTYTLSEPCLLARNVNGTAAANHSVLTNLELTGNATLAYGYNLGDLFYISNLNIYVQDSTDYAGLYLYDVAVLVDNVHMQASRGRLITTEYTLLVVFDSTFSGLAGEATQVLRLVISQVELHNTVFSHIHSPGAPVIYAESCSLKIFRSSFDRIYGEFGGSILSIYSDISIADSEFKHNRANSTTFQANSGAGILFIGHPSIVNELSINNTDFLNCTAGFGSAVAISIAKSAIIDNCTFVANTAALYGAGVDANFVQDFVVQNCIFSRNLAQGHTSMTVRSSNLEMLNNTFYLNYAIQRSPGVTIGSFGNPEIGGPYNISIVDNNFYDNHLTTSGTPADLIAISMYLHGDLLVTIEGGTYSDDNLLVPSVILGALTCTITHSRQSPGVMPIFRGLTLASSNATIMGDLDVKGSLQVIAADAQRPFALLCHLQLNNHVLSANAFPTVPNFIQSAVFMNGTLLFSNGETSFCCTQVQNDSILPFLGISFVGTSFVANGSALVFGKSTLSNITFSGAQTTLKLAGNARMEVANAQNSFATVPNLLVTESAMLTAVNFVLDGNVDVSPGAYLRLTPTWWKGLNAEFTVSGTANLQGSLLLIDALQIAPFPPTSFLLPPARVFSCSGSMSFNGNVSSPSTVFYQTTVLSNTISAASTRLQPTVILETDMGVLNVHFSADPNVTISSNCSGLVDLDSNNFDLPSLHCVRKNSTLVVLSSASLPLPYMTSLVIDTSSTAIKTSSSPIRLKNDFVPRPVAVIRPLTANSIGCGSITLDASLSQGFGSYEGRYGWFLNDTNDSTQTANAITDLFLALPINETSVQIPLSILSYDKFYVIDLFVANMFGSTSERATINITFNDPSLFLPPLLHDGPVSRQTYLGLDLVLKGIVNIRSCSWISTKTRFEWVEISAGGAEIPLGTDSPSLHLPASYLASRPVNSLYRFQLRAFPASLLGLSSDLKSSIDFTVLLLQRPLAVISTSRTSFSVEEPIILSVEAISTTSPNSLSCEWTVLACPENYAEDWFRPLSVSGLVQQGFNCVNSTGSGFRFPFTFPDPDDTLRTSITAGTVEAGNYVIGARVTTNFEEEMIWIPITVYDQAGSSSPQVIISLLNSFMVHADEKIVLIATVDGHSLDSPEILGDYDFRWLVPFGDLTILPSQNGLPVLVIPAGSLVPNQRLFIQLEVVHKVLDVPAGVSNIQLPISRAPTGGKFIVSPITGISTETNFELLTSAWTSPFLPLRYQFSTFTLSGSEISLSEVMDVPSLTNVTLLGDDLGDTNVTIRVRIFDALNQVSISEYSVLIHPKVTPIDNLQAILQEIETAFNATDWRRANNLIVSQILSRGLVPTLSNNTIDYLWNVINTLLPTVSLTESNTAILLSQLERILSDQPNGLPLFDSSQLSGVLGLINKLLSAESAKFGTSSQISLQATTNFVKTIARSLELLKSIPLDPLPAIPHLTLRSNQDLLDDPLELIRLHGSLLLRSMVPGETAFIQETDSFHLASLSLLASSTAPASTVIAATPRSEASVSFSSDIASNQADPVHVLGYTFTYFNGTYPHLAENEGFNIVVDFNIRVQPSLSGSGRSMLGSTSNHIGTEVTGPVRTVFNVTSTQLDSLKTPVCSRWDSTTQSWNTNGCSTSSRPNGQSQVQCDCLQGGALSLIFGAGQNEAKSPTTRKQTKGAVIAAAVIVPIVIVAVIVTAVVYIWKHPLYAKSLFKKAPAAKGNGNAAEMTAMASPSTATAAPSASTHSSAPVAWTKSTIPPNV